MTVDAVLAPGFAGHPDWWKAAPPGLRAPDIGGRADIAGLSAAMAGLARQVAAAERLGGGPARLLSKAEASEEN